VIIGDLPIFPLNTLVSKMISSRVLSPTASTSLSRGAFVHPQPGFTDKIFSESSPFEKSQNTCVTMEFCGTKPKLNSVSGITMRGADIAKLDSKNSKQSTSMIENFNLMF
jgi:hypothetical protein